MNLQVLSATQGATQADAPAVERWTAHGKGQQVQIGSFHGADTQDYAFLQASAEIDRSTDLKTLTEALYAELLVAAEALGKPRFMRIWNYIPDITSGEGDAERYRQFCWGRAKALGATTLPAATGIGSRDGWVRIGALCTTADGTPHSAQITHLENPRQLSAYRYPRQYGPRSPSFARATLVAPPAQAERHAGDSLLLLSGTASIVHHETQHIGDVRLQNGETARNIHALLATLADKSVPLAIRYYLRNPEHLDEIRDLWSTDFGDWPLPTVYSADICRRELELEIEAVFRV